MKKMSLSDIHKPVIYFSVFILVVGLVSGFLYQTNRVKNCGKLEFSVMDKKPLQDTSTYRHEVYECFISSNVSGKGAQLTIVNDGVDSGLEDQFTTKDHVISLLSVSYGGVGSPNKTTRSYKCSDLRVSDSSISLNCGSNITLFPLNTIKLY